MGKWCIYKLTNRITEEGYVGKTDDFKTRMRNHRNPKQSPNMLISKAIKKDGIENFKVEKLLDNVSKDVDENFYIERENTRVPNGYNQRRGEGSGCVTYNEYHKRWQVNGPRPEKKFVGYYDNEEKANEALDLFLRTGERLESDTTMRKRGTGSIRVTDSGRYEARITVKGKPYCKTFDTWDECEIYLKHILDTYS